MSRTMTPGLVDESHWTFVAIATAEGIRRGKGSLALAYSEIPRGVYRAVRDFFRMVMEGVESNACIPSNPVAAAANYAIAIRATWGPTTEAEYHATLRRYAAILTSLEGSVVDPEPTLAELEDLAAFFERIAREGESKAYGKRMSGCHDW